MVVSVLGLSIDTWYRYFRYLVHAVLGTTDTYFFRYLPGLDVILASDYPKPHVFSVIQGTIDDDIDALANHDGTMEHTLVDSPKQSRGKKLQDVAAKGGRRKLVK